MEEDAGKSLHEDFRGPHGEASSGIDLNRAGTPLLEIVTEPVMRSAAEAVAYAKALHSLVVWLGVCCWSARRPGLARVHWPSSSASTCRSSGKACGWALVRVTVIRGGFLSACSAGCSSSSRALARRRLVCCACANDVSCRQSNSPVNVTAGCAQRRFGFSRITYSAKIPTPRRATADGCGYCQRDFAPL